jgi:hypothetical protein
MIYVSDTFALDMVVNSPARIRTERIGLHEAREMLAFPPVTAVSDEATAGVFSRLLGRYVLAKQSRPRLVPGDVLLVGQYSGPPPREGSTELPEGAEVRWTKVRVEIE